MTKEIIENIENTDTPPFSNQSTSKGTSLYDLTETNWQEVAASRYIELPGDDEDETPLVELVTEIESFRFATRRNFSVILGKPKSRKSTFVALLLSEILKNQK